MKPTLYVTNWSSKKLYGPGRRWTIMARPRQWEHGQGFVPLLVPITRDIRRVRRDPAEMMAYRADYLRVLATYDLSPGALRVVPEPGLGVEVDERGMALVQDGDTLCCGCSREAAANSECHRVWAAEMLIQAGWRVVLDGQEADLHSLQCRRDKTSAAEFIANALDKPFPAFAGMRVTSRGPVVTATANPIGLFNCAGDVRFPPGFDGRLPLKDGDGQVIGSATLRDGRIEGEVTDPATVERVKEGFRRGAVSISATVQRPRCPECEHPVHEGRMCGQVGPERGEPGWAPNGHGGANCVCDLREGGRGLRDIFDPEPDPDDDVDDEPEHDCGEDTCVCLPEDI